MIFGVGDFQWPTSKELRFENLQGYGLKGEQLTKLSTKIPKAIVVVEAKENVPLWEEIFGWCKTTGCFRKSRYRVAERTHAQGQYVVATWNLVRMAKLMAGAPPGTARA